MNRTVRVALTLHPLPTGGYGVSSPELPGLVTEGETEAQALENAWDALLALLDACDQLAEPLPFGLSVNPDRNAVQFETRVAA